MIFTSRDREILNQIYNHILSTRTEEVKNSHEMIEIRAMLKSIVEHQSDLHSLYSQTLSVLECIQDDWNKVAPIPKINKKPLRKVGRPKKLLNDK